MRLGLDVETSGLKKSDLPLDDPSQPHIAQISCGLYDGLWRKVSGMSVLIKPDGWTMEPEAQKHHRLSEAHCSKYGVPIIAALAMVQGFCAVAAQIIGHNVGFDRDMITVELHRLGADALWWRKKAHSFIDTQDIGKALCKLPGRFGDYKFPSLVELHHFLFPAEPFSERHEAEHDMRAAMKIAAALNNMGLLPDPTMRSPALDAKWNKS